jgi:hypothetical protein
MDTKIPIEQSVLIIGCLNPIVSKAAIDSAKENGVEAIILEDRVIYDYLHNKGLKEETEKRSMNDFLNNTSNRIHAQEQGVKLWTILTGGQPIEKANEVIFTRSDVVKATNLTHNKADKIFQFLRAFGMLEFTKGNYEFRFIFDKNIANSTIKTEIISLCNAMNHDILRYKSLIDSDEELSIEQKQELYKTLHKTIDEIISF